MVTVKQELTYSEMVGSLLRQERQADGAPTESVVEQLVRQLENNVPISEIALDLSAMVSCPECDINAPCARCRATQNEMTRQLKDYLRRIQAQGLDAAAHIREADRFHALWQDRFEQLHMAAMGGEMFC